MSEYLLPMPKQPPPDLRPSIPCPCGQELKLFRNDKGPYPGGPYRWCEHCDRKMIPGKSSPATPRERFLRMQAHTMVKLFQDDAYRQGVSHHRSFGVLYGWLRMVVMPSGFEGGFHFGYLQEEELRTAILALTGTRWGDIAAHALTEKK